MFNKYRKSFLLLTLIIITILGASVISATEITSNTTDTINIAHETHTEDIQSTSSNNEIKKITTNNIKESGETTFTELNNKITENDNITLENTYTKTDDETPITINKTVNIEGNGNTILSENGLFIISSTGNVTFKNVDFYGGEGSNSAFKVSGILNLINCTFTYHHSNSKAFDVTSGATVNVEGSDFSDIESQGAFYLASSTTANFKNCEFSNCINTVYGGAITNYRSGTLTIENCTFNSNTAALRGGAIYTSGGTLILKNSIFTGNTVETNQIKHNQGGRALYVEGEVYLYNNTMQNNIGLSADIYNSYATIHTPVTITVNNSTAEEGAEVNISATIVDDNNNTIDLISYSTGISGLDETVYMTHFNFTIAGEKYNITRNNSANGLVKRSINQSLNVGEYDINVEYWDEEFKNATIIPGILNITETPVYTYTKLQQKITETNETTLLLDHDVKRGSTETTVNITKNIIIDLNANKWDANNEQALIIDENANVTIKNGIIINVDNSNPTSTNYYGRLARITTGSLTLENITITNSTATSFPNREGNFIRLGTNAGITLNNCTIKNTVGTLIIDNGKGTININNTLFENNKLETDYTGLITINGKTNINNTIFKENTANYAIIYGKTQNNELKINNVSFIRNIVSVGAPVYTSDDTTVTNSLFQDNRATRMLSRSGAIFTEGGSLTVTNSTFTGNTANDNDGTIIHHTGILSGDLTITNSILIPANNKAAIYNEAEDNTIKATANYNYWGTNNTPTNYVKSGSYEEEDEYSYDTETYDCTPIEVKYWIVMNTTVTPNENLKVGDKVTLETTYNTYTDGVNYYNLQSSIPDIKLEYSASTGTINPTVTTQNSVATTEYKIDAEQTTINITDKYNTNTIQLTATTKQPETIILNNENWTYYFDNDGFIKDSIVAPGSELRFDGEFNDKIMIITIPVNLTTADNQAKMNNCIFVIESSNVNITKLEINNNEQETALITSYNQSNIRIESNKLTITNTGNRMTRAIELTNTNNVIIKNNTITTTGPEKDISYSPSGNNIGIIYTTSIEASKTNGLIIDNNTITTKSYNQTVNNQETIYGIFIEGEYIEDEEEAEEIPVNNVQITNNKIHTEAKKYAYGLIINHAENALIENNTITTNTTYYAAGIQSTSITNSTYNKNTIQINGTELSYGIIVNGFLDYTTGQVNIVENNQIINNNININSNNAWAIEVYISEDNNIENNTITIIGQNTVGIGLGDSERSIVSHNTINITSNMEIPENNGDTITSYPAGIKICPTKLKVKTANNNTITYNNITVNAPKQVPAINSSTNSNKITENYLISPIGNGDNAVIDTGSYGTIENNTPVKDNSQEIEELLRQIEELKKQLEEKNKTIEEQNQTINDLNNTIQNLNDTINEQNNIINNLTNNLNEANQTINEQNEKINQINNKLEETNQTIKEQNQTINELNDKITEQNNTINQLTNNLTEANNTIKEQNDKINEINDKLEETNNTINEQNQIIQELNNTVQTQNNTINNLTQNINDANNTINNQNQTINELNNKITEQNNTINELTNTLTEANNTINEQNNKINNITSKLEETNNTINEQNQVIQELNNTVKAQNETINNLNKTTQELNNTIQELTKSKNTTITLNPINTTKYNDNVTIKGILVNEDSISLTGQTVTININGKNITTTTTNGIFEYTYTAKELGQQNIIVTYNGNDKYTGSEASTNFYVQKKPVLYFYSAGNTTEDETVTVTGKLLNNGKAISGATVTLNVNGEDVTVTPNKDGYFKYSFKAIAGENIVTATYAGTTEYAEATATTTVNAMMKTTLYAYKIENANTQDTIKVSGKLLNKGKAVVGETVTILVNGQTYTATTNKDGYFQVNVKVATAGENQLTVTYAGSDAYLAAQYNSTFTTKAKTSLFAYTLSEATVGSPIKISGKLQSNKQAVANKEVTVKVGTNTFTATTNKDGYYSVSYTPSSAGTENVVISFAGDKEYFTSTYNTTLTVI